MCQARRRRHSTLDFPLMPPKKRPSASINKIWFYLTELVGLGLSVYLFLVAASIVNIPCPRNSIFACTGVVRGTFGHIGPFSIAAMGMVYYLCQLMLTVGLRERSAQRLKFLLVLSGLVFVAWLRALELIYIREICPWCWGVALVTLIHAGIAYKLMVPPLPRLKPGGIVGVVIGGFIVLIGLVSLVELSVGPGKLMQESSKASATTPGEDKAGSAPIATPAEPVKTPTPAKTPSPTPRPTRTPAPAPTASAAGQQPVAPTPTSTPAPTPTPTPTPTPAPVVTFDPEPNLPASEEVNILRRRGWRHAPSGDSVVKAVKIQPPVLMLAYDPHCSDCHRLITQTLDNDAMNGLRVTRVAIQESMLNGQVNAMVTEIPTLILFGEDGSVLEKQVGSRITANELVKKVNQALKR